MFAAWLAKDDVPDVELTEDKTDGGCLDRVIAGCAYVEVRERSPSSAETEDSPDGNVLA
jgi:hypothetical protein